LGRRIHPAASAKLGPFFGRLSGLRFGGRIEFAYGVVDEVLREGRARGTATWRTERHAVTTTAGRQLQAGGALVHVSDEHGNLDDAGLAGGL